MQDNDSPQFQELHEVLRSAQIRRSAELGTWLKQYFDGRRQAGGQKEPDLSTIAPTFHGPTT